MRNIPVRLLIFLLNGISRLSWKKIYRISDGMRWIIFDLFKYRKKVITENLKRSFPDKTDAERAQIERAFHQNITDIMVESIKLRSMSREEVGARFEIDATLLNEFYARKQNPVVVLGHLGNWEMANLFASSHFLHQVVAVYHPLTNPVFEKYLYDIRTRFGSEMIPMKEAYTRSPVPGEKPFLFFLVNDQSPNPQKAYWTTFLNQDTGMFRGVEQIARTFNSPVVYACIERNEQRRGHYRVQLKTITENPSEVPLNGILEQQARLLEADIRKQPANWLWSHKRWKHAKPAKLDSFQLLEKTPRRAQTH
ncbi:lysophospholipid acyltransferase family protein [Arundinibacter roseus]|uniref:Lipid A biosynthesis acyltransferase n=1 Tax=Arundinibacter roseus TaxID=2070510 RepID=A0A4R4K6J2_9BACT|nr:lipid A biosynthesis acyltransferase [Arundinibacter roseus]TDB61839.1 lipid A biosynthesis acyltransferase [Arundinibacter roseus]